MGDTVLGPIDYLAVEWPDRHVTGEGFRLLMDLVDRGIVRVLDILFIGKNADGNVSKVEVADVEHADALDERLWGLSSGLLDQSDIDQLAAAIEPQGVPAPVAAVVQPGSAPPIAAASPEMGDRLAQLKQLKQLGELRESGVLTEAEFEAQKAQILSA